MGWTRSVAFLALLTLGACHWLTASEPSAESPVDATKTAGRMIEIFELVLDHHVSPPTMQQMVHQSLLTAYARCRLDPPGGLAKEISAIHGKDQLRMLVEREFQVTKPAGETRELLGNWLSFGLAGATVNVVPTKTQRVNDQFASNRYVGIGITIMSPTGDYPQMHKVMPGGPADQAGAKKGDAIVEVDGKDTLGVSLEQVIDRLRGVEGSDVEVMLRTGTADRKVTMTRRVVPLPTIAPPVSSKSGETIGISFLRISASNVHELRKINTSLRCNECHSPPLFTSPKVQDVGLRDEAGNEAFNPPSLRGLRYRRAFFHDARARTLESVFLDHRHQIADHVSKRKLQPLLSYLRTL